MKGWLVVETQIEVEVEVEVEIEVEVEVEIEVEVEERLHLKSSLWSQFPGCSEIWIWI